MSCKATKVISNMSRAAWLANMNTGEFVYSPQENSTELHPDASIGVSTLIHHPHSLKAPVQFQYGIRLPRDQLGMQIRAEFLEKMG
ncbi:hypothetical protein SDJN03_19514, partial [Cucurbita argyrosperma subsp. sororia]